MTGLVDKGRAVDIVYLSFSMASDTISHYILTQKLMKYGLDEPILSEVDWKLTEWLGPEGGDQWHEFYLEASN